MLWLERIIAITLLVCIVGLIIPMLLLRIKLEQLSSKTAEPSK